MLYINLNFILCKNYIKLHEHFTTFYKFADEQLIKEKNAKSNKTDLKSSDENKNNKTLSDV